MCELFYFWFVENSRVLVDYVSICVLKKKLKWRHWYMNIANYISVVLDSMLVLFSDTIHREIYFWFVKWYTMCSIGQYSHCVWNVLCQVFCRFSTGITVFRYNSINEAYYTKVGTREFGKFPHVTQQVSSYIYKIIHEQKYTELFFKNAYN